MKNILRVLAVILLAAFAFHSQANAKQGECNYEINNIVATAEKVGPDFGDALTFKVHATGEATYTHKNGSTRTEIVNLDQGATVAVGVSEPLPYHETAKKKAEALLHKQAAIRLGQLCTSKGCNK